MSTEELLERAKTLSPSQQLELVEALLNELDHPDAAIDAAWTAEARDRLAAYRSGRLRAIPLEEVIARYR